MDGILKMLERLPVPVVIANPLTAKVLWANSHLVDMARAKHPDQLVGTSILDFVQPQQQGIALADLAKVALGGSPPPAIYDLKRLDGETAAAHVASIPLLFRNQPAMLSLVTDVSDRERLIRDLADSEERWRTLLDNTPSGIVVVVDDIAAYVNPALARALGFEEPADVIGRAIYDFIDPEMRREVREARRQVIMTGDPLPATQLRMVRLDGTVFETRATVTRVRWEGEVATQTLIHDL